jgi:ADP-ribosylglycohydrolase
MSSKTSKTNKTKDINDNKYYQILILHALGDTIGFNNGRWEFNDFITENNRSIDYINQLIYEYMGYGGLHGMDISKWSVSDDTLLHMSVAKSLLEYKYGDNSEIFYTNHRNVLMDMNDNINRYYGKKTTSSLKNIHIVK